MIASFFYYIKYCLFIHIELLEIEIDTPRPNALLPTHCIKAI